MRVAIRKWGNSLAVRLPVAAVRVMAVSDGSEVELALDGQQLLIRRVDPSASLGALLAGVTPENLHGEVSTGRPRGHEVW
ncbi:MAG: AbrB/MazE/SpoVT family DNA-binding domain-containing protein [Gemmatimonadaceae bacterium]|nr:AbrB/MazE/SpoVT family DNA-binding domain-containing protein [Gemmatimonadaceae bacterium]